MYWKAGCNESMIPAQKRTAHSLFYNWIARSWRSQASQSCLLLSWQRVKVWLYDSLMFYLCFVCFTIKHCVNTYTTDAYYYGVRIRDKSISFRRASQIFSSSGDICPSLPTPISKIVDTGFLDLGLYSKLNLRKLFTYVGSQIKIGQWCDIFTMSWSYLQTDKNNETYDRLRLLYFF